MQGGVLYRRDIPDVLPPDPSSAQRPKAIIDGSFSPRHFHGSKRKVWMQFMIASQSEPHIGRVYNLMGERFMANIRDAVKRLVPE